MLLEAAGRLVRPPVKPNTPRPGWLVTSAEKAVDGPGDVEPSEAVDAPEDAVEVTADQRIHALARAVVRALEAGNGRSNRCETEEELRSRLADDGVGYHPQDLASALSLLES